MKNAAEKRGTAGNGKRIGRIGKAGKIAQASISGSGRIGRKSQGGTPPGCLAGGHLLTLPELGQFLMEKEPEKICMENLIFSNIFHVPQDQIKYGMRENLQMYVNEKFSLSGIDPVNYEIFLCDIQGIKDFVYEFDEEEFAADNHYLCLALISSRKVYDCGAQLEVLERKHPSWGKYLLSLIGNNGVLDILTPDRCYEEADRYWNWMEEPDSEWESTVLDTDITPEKIKEYYPAWIFEKAPENCPEDLAEIPEIAAFQDAVKNWYDREKNDPSWASTHFMELPGSYASAGIIAWTKGRNELERDPVVVASDEECNSYNESEGCNPGAVLFEFLLKTEHEKRNCWIKKNFDLFLSVLCAFEKMMDWISKEGAK